MSKPPVANSGRDGTTRKRRMSRNDSVSFDAVEAQREDLAELKRKVEDEIRRDKQKLSFIRDTLQKSKDVEQEMVETLSIFDTRLSTLETSIKPIHDETLKLTMMQENLSQVADLLQESIRYHKVSQNMGKIVNNDITKENLDGYLEALKLITEARHYFESKVPGNPEGGVLISMESTAVRKLEEEFAAILKSSSIPTSQLELLRMTPINMMDVNTLIAEESLKVIQKILQIMVERQLTEGIFYEYSNIRTKVVISLNSEGNAALSPLRREKKGKGLMQSIRRKSQTLSMDFSKSPVASEDQTSNKRSLNRDNSKRSVKGHRRAPSFDKNARDSIMMMEAEAEAANMYEKGTHTYFLYFSAILVALEREVFLITKLVGAQHNIELKRLVLNPVMDVVLQKGESVVETMSRRTVRGAAGLCLLDILQLFRSKMKNINLILECCSPDVAQRFGRLVETLSQLGFKSLVEFQDYTQSDDAKKLPSDGTVHELTSNTLKYLNALSEYDTVTGYLLASSGTIPRDEDPLSRFEITDSTQAGLVNWITSVLTTLCENLSRKSRTFESPTLGAVFLANNYDHILKYIATSEHSSLFRKFDDKIDTKYMLMIRQQRDVYQEATWGSIVPYIAGPFYGENSALSKKERELVKDKYSGFNEGLEAAVEMQKSYSIPNEVLRNQIRQENANYILPLFEAFDNAYRNSGFSVKNPHKYLKYSGAMVERMLQDFFRAQ